MLQTQFSSKFRAYNHVSCVLSFLTGANIQPTVYNYHRDAAEPMSVGASPAPGRHRLCDIVPNTPTNQHTMSPTLGHHHHQRHNYLNHMRSRRQPLLIVAAAAVVALLHLRAPAVTAIHWDHAVHLNADYRLLWSLKQQDITFEVQVRTAGYVGLGFSPDGERSGADMAIGWIDQGQTYFQVCGVFVCVCVYWCVLCNPHANQRHQCVMRVNRCECIISAYLYASRRRPHELVLIGIDLCALERTKSCMNNVHQLCVVAHACLCK